MSASANKTKKPLKLTVANVSRILEKAGHQAHQKAGGFLIHKREYGNDTFNILVWYQPFSVSDKSQRESMTNAYASTLINRFRVSSETEYNLGLCLVVKEKSE